MRFYTSTMLIASLALSLNGCAQTAAPPGAAETGQSTTGAPGDAAGSGPPVYRVLYTGREGQPTDAMRQEALKAAAKTARAQGHTHFAVIEERIETVVGSGPVSGVGVNIPVVRSLSGRLPRTVGIMLLLSEVKRTESGPVAEVA